ncbi:MAG TPA: iron-sulfur cluster insertion protein ErpA [Gammaproteobacteria bacterium]|nr:iron-sulfur cluster insertion protein ErpA [Gammaproteobacteria bacterium]
MGVCNKRTLDVVDKAAPVIFSENAAAKVQALIEEEGNTELKLRVCIESGGCSGLQYGFQFDENIREDDAVYTTNGVNLLVGSESQNYLAGATIDYVDDLEGERFVIENPNAKSTCGCGSSFDIED